MTSLPKKWRKFTKKELIAFAKKTYKYSDDAANKYANIVLKYRK